MGLHSTIPLSAAGTQARAHDNDRYLCCLFAPPELREALFALLAFNMEIARVGETVSQEMLGLIRLTWWREALDELYAQKTPRRHDIVEALQTPIILHTLTRGYFDDMLEGREQDIVPDAPSTLADLERYAELTSSSLLYLWLEILGNKDEAALLAAKHLGIAWGLVGLMRAIPAHAARNKVFLPQELIDTEATFNELPLLRKAVRNVLDCAKSHRAELMKYRAVWAASALPLRQLIIMCDHYIARIARADFNPYHSSMRGGKFALQTKLLLNSFRG